MTVPTVLAIYFAGTATGVWAMLALDLLAERRRQRDRT